MEQPPQPDSSHPTASAFKFLGLPLELRRLIYAFCIPQNLRFTLCWSDHRHIFFQNRPVLWRPPPWHSKGSSSRKGTYYSFRPRKRCKRCNTCASGATPSRASNQPQNASSNDDSDLYCRTCCRYRPDVPAHRRSALPELLLVCRQITDEVETMLYGGNIFQIPFNAPDDKLRLRDFSPERRQKMSKMTLVVRLSYLSRETGFRVDPEFWQSILADLAAVEIIAEEVDEETFEGKDRLMPVLEYLARVLHSDIQIVVKTQNSESTVAMVEAALPRRCRFQELTWADLDCIYGMLGEMSNPGDWDIEYELERLEALSPVRRR